MNEKQAKRIRRLHRNATVASLPDVMQIISDWPSLNHKQRGKRMHRLLQGL